jgi:hypothetical protein
VEAAPYRWRYATPVEPYPERCRVTLTVGSSVPGARSAVPSSDGGSHAGQERSFTSWVALEAAAPTSTAHCSAGAGIEPEIAPPRGGLVANRAVEHGAAGVDDEVAEDDLGTAGAGSGWSRRVELSRECGRAWRRGWSGYRRSPR